MNMELILTDVELGIEVQDSKNNSFDVYYHKKNGIFVAVNPITRESYRYKLTKTVEEILYELSDEILKSRLSKVTKDDKVDIGDIFMYGKYVERIN